MTLSMRPLEIGFWTATACVVYTYLAYPLAIGVLARVRGQAGPARARALGLLLGRDLGLQRGGGDRASARRVRGPGRRLGGPGGGHRRLRRLDRPDGGGRARARGGGVVRVLERAENRGKASSLNEGCAAARNEVVVFADARQTWAPDALARLLENFPTRPSAPPAASWSSRRPRGSWPGVGLYWRFEKWLRQRESRVHSTVGVTGAICAVRRELFRPIPAGTILDDVYWPLRVVMRGYRVVFDDRARAFDRLPGPGRDEFRRKVRTLSGNFQLLARLPAALLPWRNPVWWQFVSHKVLRLVVPWALLLILAASLPLARAGMIYRAALAAQAVFYLLGLAGVGTAAGSRRGRPRPRPPSWS